MPAVPFDALTQAPRGEPSVQIRARVQRAIAFRRKRPSPTPQPVADKGPQDLLPLPLEAVTLLKSAMQEWDLSARSYTKILKIARTIADLAASDEIRPEPVAEAIQYRSLDRQLWV